ANFGVATAFEFRLHPVGPKVTSGAAVFPVERAREVAALYRDLARSAPLHMHLGLGFATAPTGRVSTPALDGRPTIAIGSMHFGDQKEAERDLRKIRREIEPLA